MQSRSTEAERQRLLAEIAGDCVVTRARVVSRVLTSIYDEAYRPFGINAPQLILLTVISRIGPASRAEIGRFNQQERSTLTRNLDLMFDEGWIEEIAREAGGRARPLAITAKGRDLLLATAPAWREAQAKAKALLGNDGARLLVTLGDSMMAQ